MSEDGKQRPDEWKAEPGDRLTRLADAACEGMKAHPEYGEDVRGIITLGDASGGGSALWGYEGTGPEPVFDMIRASGHLLATLGLRLELSAGAGPEQETFSVPQPPLPEGPHETVRLTLIVDPGHARLGRIGKAVKAALESAGEDWGVSKLIIMAGLEEESAILYHGLEGEPELLRQLLSAAAQVAESGGGQIVLIPMDSRLN